MEIRLAKKSDYKAVMTLYAAFAGDDRYEKPNSDSFDRVLASPSNFIYVAQDGEKLVGFATLTVKNVVRYSKPIAELDEIFVAAAWQKHGIGHNLVEAVEAKARELGCYRVYIESQYRHTPAHKFYGKLGYENYGYHFKKDL